MNYQENENLKYGKGLQISMQERPLASSILISSRDYQQAHRFR
jgi:hypothetical protein